MTRNPFYGCCAGAILAGFPYNDAQTEIQTLRTRVSRSVRDFKRNNGNAGLVTATVRTDMQSEAGQKLIAAGFKPLLHFRGRYGNPILLLAKPLNEVLDLPAWATPQPKKAKKPSKKGK